MAERQRHLINRSPKVEESAKEAASSCVIRLASAASVGDRACPASRLRREFRHLSDLSDLLP